MSNCCSHGTLLHFGLQSSHLNICYCHQDLRQKSFRPGSRPTLCCEPLRIDIEPSQEKNRHICMNASRPDLFVSWSSSLPCFLPLLVVSLMVFDVTRGGVWRIFPPPHDSYQATPPSSFIRFPISGSRHYQVPLIRSCSIGSIWRT